MAISLSSVLGNTTCFCRHNNFLPRISGLQKILKTVCFDAIQTSQIKKKFKKKSCRANIFVFSQLYLKLSFFNKNKKIVHYIMSHIDRNIDTKRKISIFALIHPFFSPLQAIHCTSSVAAKGGFREWWFSTSLLATCLCDITLPTLPAVVMSSIFSWLKEWA